MLPCWSVCVSVGQSLASQLLLRQLYQIMQKGPWSTGHVCAPAWARAHARSSLRDAIRNCCRLQFACVALLAVPKNNDIK